MIYIEEKETKKCPGLTSLFVNFKYRQEYVDIIKKCDCPIFNKKDKFWEVPVSELSKLINNFSLYDDIELNLLQNDNGYRDTSIKEVEKNNFKTMPFEYQIDGINYGLENNKWLLLDAPGLGKSLQIIYTAQELKKRENLEHCLIICGINTLKTNWKKEIEKHSDLSCRILGQKITKNGELKVGGIPDRIKDLKSNIEEFFVITNIETLRNSEIIKNINSGKNKFDIIIYDEIHTAKNPTAEQSKNFLKLNSAKYKIGATGTVLTNSPVDAYVPLKWIGKERSNFSTFKYYYIKYGGPFNNEVLGFKHIDVLKNQLSTCSLRRTKDLLDLPEKTIINEIVDMTPEQEILYKNIKDGIINQVDKVNIDNSSIFSMLARLRQATACPSILTTENIQSAKILRCIDLIEQMLSNNEKVVVYSTFKETLNVLYEKIKQYNPVICTGDVSDDMISSNIDKFQNNKDCKIMLATWSKMGTGITLTAASNAIFIDCSWTKAANLQAEDRIYRIGSKKPVFIYYLWANNTVDMKVKDLVEDKSLVADFVVDDIVQPQLMSRLKQIIVDLC